MARSPGWPADQRRAPNGTVAVVHRRFLTPGWIAGHLLVLLAVVVCLRLGWWQWDRSREATGTIQNLGYAVLWPVFGAAFIYMWVRFLQLERGRDSEDDAELDADLAALTAEHAAADPTAGDESGITADSADQAEPEEEPGGKSRSTVLSVAIVGDDDDEEEDSQLAAYNRALAALAERDRRRGH